MEEGYILCFQHGLHSADTGLGHIAVVVDFTDAILDRNSVILIADTAAAVHDQGQLGLFRDHLHPVQIQHRL